ncbi:outer membrane beta-barrel protein, partial [candidate division KSB1 bacterium]
RKTLLNGMLGTFLIVLMSTLVSTEVFAQNKPFSISFGGGFGDLPLSDVIDFTKSAGLQISDGGRRYVSFDKDDHGRNIDLKIVYRINELTNVALHTGRISIRASGVTNHIWFGGISATVDEDWKFSAIPVGVSYEIVFADRNSRFLPVVGVGPSFYISRMTRIDRPVTIFQNGFSSEGDEINRVGYGIQVYFELQSSINSSLYVNSRLRGRYTQGMENNDLQVLEKYNIDFSGIDFTLGFGWRF